ncbi:MAG: hypothetical protein LBS75_10300 [Synergistaceae bacterium]|jgi:hypothetical protein|nr:hypothetical protein [Synergistaceae bacterium]
MFQFDEIASLPPFSLGERDKDALFEGAMADITQYHFERCHDYRKIVQGLGFDPKRPCGVSDFPFLPARIFKSHELLSADRSDIVKTMTSSGTTGQSVSKIFLDRETSARQTKALVRITSDFLGGHRLPMLVIDSSELLKDRKMFSARGAGILGFSMLGRDVTYALDGEMRLNFEAMEAFLDRHRGEKVLLFGFTFMIWEHFCKALAESGRWLPIEGGILVHGGGWKKLRASAVSSDEFKEALRSVCGVSRVHNYYGMVEQTGSIFMECEEGRLHCSLFSDVIVRRHGDFSPCRVGEEGLIQVLSLLPVSYPGHSILTEDAGLVTGVDDCPCGRLGRTFAVKGRIAQAEVRGCGDTYERG